MLAVLRSHKNDASKGHQWFCRSSALDVGLPFVLYHREGARGRLIIAQRRFNCGPPSDTDLHHSAALDKPRTAGGRQDRGPHVGPGGGPAAAQAPAPLSATRSGSAARVPLGAPSGQLLPLNCSEPL